VDYGETFQAALKVGPKWCRARVANHGKSVINALICILQPAFCAPYIVFIADNIKQLTNLPEPLNTDRIIMVMMIPALVLVLWVRNIKFLGYTSKIGNFLLLVGFVIILQYLIRTSVKLNDPEIKREDFTSFFGVIECLCMMVFSFEGKGSFPCFI